MTNILFPHEDYFETAMCLHPDLHLGNQFWREGMWVLRNTKKTYGAYGTCLEFKYSLCEYLKACYFALIIRKGKSYYKQLFEINMIQSKLEDTGPPPVIGNPDFHAAHRSALLRKDKKRGWGWYDKMGWVDPLDLKMVY